MFMFVVVFLYVSIYIIRLIEFFFKIRFYYFLRMKKKKALNIFLFLSWNVLYLFKLFDAMACYFDYMHRTIIT